MIFFEIYFVTLGHFTHFFVFLVTLCWYQCIWKTATSLSLYGLASYMESTSSMSLARDSGRPFRSFLWMCLLWTSACKFLIRGNFWFLFSGVYNLLLPLVFVCDIACPLEQQQHTTQLLFLSIFFPPVALWHWEYTGFYHHCETC